MILKSNLKSKEPLKFDMQDIRLASCILQVPAGELQALLSFVEEITNRRAQSAMKVKSIISFDRYYQLFEDRTFVLDTPRRDWVLICLIYLIYNTEATLVSSAISNFYSFAKRWISSRQEITETQKKIKQLHSDLYTAYSVKEYVYFNTVKFLETAKKMGINAVIEEGNLVLEWKDVMIKSAKDEVLYYESISLYLRIPDMYVNRYKITSHKFTYDSDWKIGIVLHPNLNDAGMLEYGRNNFIEFLPTGNYELVLLIIDELIRCKSDFTFANFNHCEDSYNKLAILWESIDQNKPIEVKEKELFNKLKG